MRMLIGLSFVVMMSASLVSSHSLKLIEHGLITEDDPVVEKDLNDRAELVQELTKVIHNSVNLPIYVKHALHTLHRMKDDQVELVPGVTVAKLIEQNDFNEPSDCSKEALHQRAELLRKFNPVNPEHLAMFEYLAKNLVNAAVQCADHRDRIDPRINDEDWLEGLMEIAIEHVHRRRRDGADVVLKHIYDYVMGIHDDSDHRRFRIRAAARKHNDDKVIDTVSKPVRVEQPVIVESNDEVEEDNADDEVEAEKEKEEAKEQVDQPEPVPAPEQPAGKSDDSQSS